MNYHPYFSIIIATYNRVDLLPRAVNSILNQSFDHWELLIVDDGSTDDTEAVVKGLGDARIRYFYKENEEKSIARNFGIERAKGKYLCFLDDDDYYLPRFLEHLYSEIRDKEEKKALFRCGEYIENVNGKRKKEYTPQKYLNNPVRFLWRMQSSIRPFAIHRDILEKHRFLEDCRYGEDFHLLIRIALEYPLRYFPEYNSVNVFHDKRGTQLKFKDNVKENAKNTLDCLDDLIVNHQSPLLNSITWKEICALKNQKIYAFASAAMKQGKRKLFIYLLRKFHWKGNSLVVIKYCFLLFIRTPFYILKLNHE